jgi:hypothetical protein
VSVRSLCTLFSLALLMTNRDVPRHVSADSNERWVRSLLWEWICGVVHSLDAGDEDDREATCEAFHAAESDLALLAQMGLPTAFGRAPPPAQPSNTHVRFDEEGKPCKRLRPTTPDLGIVDAFTPNPLADEGVLTKYWNQRYRLFSRYDEGMCLSFF